MELVTTRLDELYSAHSVYLRRFMFKLTQNQEEANDLVQDTFLRLCQQVILPEHPKEWLSLTGYRLFVDQWRRNKRIAWSPLDYLVVSNETTPEQVVLDKEFEKHVLRMLLRFKPRMRTAFYLRIFKQFSYREIARALDCSENTVKSFIRRGKAQINI